MADVGIVYLASKSPRRLQLLSQIGIKASVIIPAVSEVRDPSESALPYVNRMAMNKAQAGWRHAERTIDMPVIGADTIVVCNNKILGKPHSKEEGIAMLRQLSGCTHQVISSVAIIYKTQIKQCHVESEVTFATLTESQIEAYWRTGEPHDKAGAYGIQGKAAAFIRSLRGSYSAVVGLPLFETATLLYEFGMAIS